MRETSLLSEKYSLFEENSDLPAGSYRSHVAIGLILVSSEATGWLCDYQFVYWEMWKQFLLGYLTQRHCVQFPDCCLCYITVNTLYMKGIYVMLKEM